METKIIQFTAGRGPVECTWVVAKVLKIFLNEIEAKNIKCKILDKQNGMLNNTVQSVSIHLEGKNLDVVLGQWVGTIQWIGKSKFRKYHKRKNWFIACCKLDQLEKITFSEKDIQFQSIRSSGPGGQHVNKVSSAIRATHGPTGAMVLVSDSRSQHQNRKIAIQRIQEKIIELNLKSLTESIKNEWENHLNIQRGNPIRVFSGDDFKSNYVDKSFKSNRKKQKQDWKKEISFKT